MISPLYLIICLDAKGEDYVPERPVAQMDLETTIRDIMSGEEQRVVRVLVTESDVPDVSEDIAYAMLKRERFDDMTSSAQFFVGRHVLTPVAA